jgi:hypothetical protein
VRVEVIRSGGLAGVRLHGVFDTGELSADAAARADTWLRRLAAGGSSSPGPPAHPDAFQYHMRVLDQDQGRSVTLNESDVPDSLRELADAAVARGDVVNGGAN